MLILFSKVRIVSVIKNNRFFILIEEISLFILFMIIMSKLQLLSNLQHDNLVKVQDEVEVMHYQIILIICSKERMYQFHHFLSNRTVWITIVMVLNHKMFEEEINLFQVLSGQDLAEQIV
jgi:hypothetical protein